MRPRIPMATILAGALVAVGCAHVAHGGWFGLGGSHKSSTVSGAARTDGRYAAKNAPMGPKDSSKGLWGTVTGWFGGSKQPSPKKYGPYVAKTTKDDKAKTSWWNSWLKPKEPPPRKSAREWMESTKPVRW